MSTDRNLGILGLGAYLPSNIRENSWWSKDIIKKWVDDKRRFSSAFDLDAIDMTTLSPEAKILIETLHALKNDMDIFEGSTQRYIMSSHEKTSDMEISAAIQALKNANLSPSKIDFLLVHSTLPDILYDANACVVHSALNLKKSCFSQDVSGMCNAFMQQLFIAQSLIKSKQANYGLLIQSSGMSRLLEAEHPSSPFFGDGATAVIVGPTGLDQGILSIKNFTHGGLGSYFTTGIPDKNWYDEGRIRTYVLNINSGPLLNFQAIEQSKLLIEEALKESKRDKSEVQFYAGHQGMSWFREATQKAIGIAEAKSYDTFKMHASLVGANVPLVSYLASKNGALKNGDLLAAFSPGSGMTASGMIMKWHL